MSKKLQVIVVFEFDDIDDPNSVEAEIATDEVAKEVEYIVEGNKWQTPISSGWVQEVFVVGEDEA